MSVALHAYVRRHIRLGMSPFTSSSSDMPGLECRTWRGSGATCSPWHVALHELVERHARAGMSRLAGIRSDMLGLACRPSRARRATCQGWNVAPGEDPERHARLGMSLRMRVKCDMDRFAVSLVRSSKATSTLLPVAPRARVGRHAAATWATSETERNDMPRWRDCTEGHVRWDQASTESGEKCQRCLDRHPLGQVYVCASVRLGVRRARARGRSSVCVLVHGFVSVRRACGGLVPTPLQFADTP